MTVRRRQCVKCGESKPIEEFSSRPGWCRPCDARYKREWRAQARGDGVDPRRQQERDRARRDVGAAMMNAAAERLAATSPPESLPLEGVAGALEVDVDAVRLLVEQRRLPRPQRDGRIRTAALLQLLRP